LGIIVMFVAVLASGCGGIPAPTTSSRQPRAPATKAGRAPPQIVRHARPKLPLAFFVVRRLSHDGTQPGKTNLITTYQIRFEYPEFTHPKFAPLNSAISDLIWTKRNTLMDQVGFLDETTLASATLPWQSTLGYRIVCATNEFVSVLFELYEYTGGAHGNTTLITFNFFAPLGELLSLDQCLVSEDAFTELSRKVRERLISRLQEMGNEAWIDHGAEPTWENYQAFSLTPDRLILYFQPYQVAPYAAGAQRVEIPWSEIQELILPDVEKLWKKPEVTPESQDNPK
jgi:hypothetical protein